MAHLCQTLDRMALLNHVLPPELLLNLTHCLLSIGLLFVLARADEPTSSQHPGLSILAHGVIDGRLIVLLLCTLHGVVSHALFEASLRLNLVGLRLEVWLDLVVVADGEFVITRSRDVLSCRVRRAGPVFVTKVDRCTLVGRLLCGHAPFRLHLDWEFEVVALWLVVENAR